MSKTRTLSVHLKYDYDVRLPNFTFSEEPKQKTTNFPSLFEQFRQSECVGIVAMTRTF